MRTTLAQACALYAETPPRGEFVLIVEGAQPERQETLTLDDAVAMALDAIRAGASKKDAVRQISAETGMAKNVLYDAVLHAE